MAKATFVLDDDTLREIRSLASRKGKPQSHIVRQAIAAYARQEERLTDEDRARKLAMLDELLARPRTRPSSAVDAELEDVRRSRSRGWQRRSD